MSRVFGFGLGPVWKWEDPPNRAPWLEYFRPLPVRAQEFTMLQRHVPHFKPTPDQVAWLSTLDHVSLHPDTTPATDAQSQKRVQEELVHIDRLYRKLEPDILNLHADQLPPPELLKPYDFNLVIENMPQKNGMDFSALERIMEAFPEAGFCLDVAHAYSWSPNHVRELLDAFGDRLAQVHWSGRANGVDHVPFSDVDAAYIEALSPVRDTDVPVIIESVFDKKEPERLGPELAWTKRFFAGDSD